MLARQIKDLLDSTQPVLMCDKCIARTVGAAVRSVRVLTGAFGLTSDFTRHPGHCPGCGEQALVIKSGGTQ